MKIIRYPICEKCGEKVVFTNPRGMTAKEIEDDWDRICAEALLMHSAHCSNENK